MLTLLSSGELANAPLKCWQRTNSEVEYSSAWGPANDCAFVATDLLHFTTLCASAVFISRLTGGYAQTACIILVVKGLVKKKAGLGIRREYCE